MIHRWKITSGEKIKSRRFSPTFQFEKKLFSFVIKIFLDWFFHCNKRLAHLQSDITAAVIKSHFIVSQQNFPSFSSHFQASVGSIKNLCSLYLQARERKMIFVVLFAGRALINCD